MQFDRVRVAANNELSSIMQKLASTCEFVHQTPYFDGMVFEEGYNPLANSVNFPSVDCAWV